MCQKYIGGIITKSPVVPSGPYETSTAKGIWTLEQAMQFKKQGIWPTAGNQAPPTVIGQAYGGGFYAGQIGVSGVATHYLVIGPVASTQASMRYKNVGTATVYPAGHFCNDLVVGGYSDWYMPAKNELEVCYYNLKPDTTSNSTGSGINANAVPARASNYTAGTPAQTSATDFRNTGAEDFSNASYWSSTESSATRANVQEFQDGAQGTSPKYYFSQVRAVRRVAV